MSKAKTQYIEWELMDEFVAKEPPETLKGQELNTFWFDEAGVHVTKHGGDGAPLVPSSTLTEAGIKSAISKLQVDAYAAAVDKWLAPHKHYFDAGDLQATSVHWSDVYKKGNQMKDNTPRLGHEARGKEPRDAIHMAVIVCKTGQWLQPGVKVVVKDGVARAATKDEKSVGVTDPFMDNGVPAGKFVWVMLNPGSITSLRHEWTHPAFPVEAAEPDPKSSAAVKRAAFAELNKIAKKVGKSGTWLFDRCETYAAEGYANVGYDAATETLNRYRDEIWGAWERITGKRRPGDAYFTCSC